MRYAVVGIREEFQEHVSKLVPDLNIHVMQPGDDDLASYSGLLK